jgi:hypothetical protein
MVDTPYAWMNIVTKYTPSASCTVTAARGVEQTVGRIKKIPAPTYTAEDIDVTDQDSAGVKQFIAGLKEGSEVEFVMNDSPNDAGQQALIGDEGYSGSMKHTFPSGRSITYPITIKTVNLIEDGKAGAISVKAKVSGTIVRGLNNINLTDMAVGTGTLVPAFSATKYDYLVSEIHGTTTVTVTPTCAAADLIQVNGQTTASAAATNPAITLTDDAITTIQVKVTKAGYTPTVYTIKVGVV